MKRQRSINGVLAVALLLALTLYLGPIPAAYAATITVNTADDELNSDGDCSLREAIQAANTDTGVDGCTAGSGADTITLPAGFYTLTILGAGENANTTGDLDITGDLTINGDPITVIQAGTNIYNGIDRVLDVHSGIVEMNHLWIEYGRTPGTANEHDGGGIRNDTTGILTLNNSYIASNTADWYGGGIYNLGELTLSNTTIRNGNAIFGGGGIFNLGTLTLIDSTIDDNAADYHGGGIWNKPSRTLTLSNSSITANSAGAFGGGIYNEGTLILNNSTVADNNGDSDYDLFGDGGGIWTNGRLELYDSTVDNNYATYGGGIYNDSNNTVILSRSTVYQNDSGYSGGGIYNADPLAFVILDSSTVDHNGAAMGHGGGIYHGGGGMSLVTCTVSGNGSGQSGGGIYVNAGTGTLALIDTTVAHNAADVDGDTSGDGGGIYVSSGSALARNTIIGNNSDFGPQFPDCWGTLTSLGYNLLENTTGCNFAPTTGDITGSDPNLGTLGDNGGPTWTHALLTGSPAIEWIPDGTNDCQAGVSEDQRGYLRAGGAGYGGSLCDIGAYEYDSAPRVVQFSAATYSVSEGAGTAIIKVNLSPASSSTVTVDYATSDGSAMAGSDYTAQSGTLTFNPGITSRTFAVPILEDALDEADETVTLTLSDPTNATIGGTSPATLIIEDNDPLPTVRFSGATYSVNEGAGSATITVNLNAASGRLVEVDCETADGTATAGSDYTTTSETVYYYPGTTSRTFTVPIIEDTQYEPSETVILTLLNAKNATIGGTNPAILTIVDNDGADFVIYLPLVVRNGSLQ